MGNICSNNFREIQEKERIMNQAQQIGIFGAFEMLLAEMEAQISAINRKATDGLEKRD